MKRRSPLKLRGLVPFFQSRRVARHSNRLALVMTALVSLLTISFTPTLVDASVHGVQVLAKASNGAADTGGAGSNIGNAAVLTGSTSASLTGNLSDDWWVIYPSTPGAAVTLKVTNTLSPLPSRVCGAISLEITNTDGGPITGAGLPAGTGFDQSFSYPSSDRYFVDVRTSGGCDPTTPITFSVEVESGGGGRVPSPASGSATGGDSIGTAWPPLQGGTLYRGNVTSGTEENWYVLYKKADTEPATVRVEDTTDYGSTSCPGVSVELTNSNGGPVNGAGLADNTAIVFTVDSSGDDYLGRYYLDITNGDCPSGGANYSIEPEPEGEWTSPAKLPEKPLPEGPAKSSAGGPLEGGVTYSTTIPTSTFQQWDEFDSNGRVPITVDVEDTSVGENPCEGISFEVETAEGEILGGAGLAEDTGDEISTDTIGAFYLEITDGDCDPGGAPPPTANVTLLPAEGIMCGSNVSDGHAGNAVPGCGTYVALGDSYSSGEGAGTYVSGTGNGNGGCDRSNNAYPELLAKALGYTGDRFIFVACSVATTDALFSSFKGQPPQLDSLSADDTLVTISIGGNNIGFGPVLKYCLSHKNCEPQEEEIVLESLQSAEGNILAAMQAIRRDAPNAKVIVVGYPNFMPASLAPSETCHPSSGILYYLAELSAADVEFIHNGIDLLDHEVQLLSAGQGFVFVQPSGADWSPHTICESGTQSWFVPVTLSAALTGHAVTFFHPTAQGQEELFEEVKPYAG